MGGAASTTESSLVLSFHSEAGWQEHFQLYHRNQSTDGDRLLRDLVRTCRFMETLLNEWASEHKEVVFVKIDVDELMDVARRWRVDAMPTFVLVKRGKEIERIVGARKDEILNKIQKLKSSWARRECRFQKHQHL